MKKAVFSTYAGDPDALQNRFALRVAARLNETALALGLGTPTTSSKICFQGAIFCSRKG